MEGSEAGGMLCSHAAPACPSPASLVSIGLPVPSTPLPAAHAGRAWLELPFAKYVADADAADARILAYAGLGRPEAVFRHACWVPWCRNFSWPNVSREEALAVQGAHG